MADRIGYKSQVGIGFEATAGQKASSLLANRFDVELPIGFRLERNLVERTVIRNTPSPMQKLIGLIKVTGMMNKELYTRQDGYLWRCAMGGTPTSTAASDVTLLSAATITPSMALTTQPTVASILKITIAGATAWGTVTIYGTDGLGNSIEELLTFTSNTTKNTTKYFKSVSNIATNAFTGGTLAVKGNANTTTHVFELKETVPTVTIEVSKGGMPWTYWGLACQTAEFKIDAPEGVTKASFSFAGKNGEAKSIGGTTTPSSLSSLANEVYMNWNMALKVAGSVQEVRAASWTLNNNIREDTSMVGTGSQELMPRAVRDALRGASGTFNCLFEDTRFFEKFMAGTPAALEIFGYNQVAAGAYESIKIEFPEVAFEGTDIEVGEAGLLFSDIPWTAFSSLGNNSEMKITIVSLDASYA